MLTQPCQGQVGCVIPRTCSRLLWLHMILLHAHAVSCPCAIWLICSQVHHMLEHASACSWPAAPWTHNMYAVRLSTYP